MTSHCLIDHTVHWQYVITDRLEGPGILTVPDHKEFQFVTCNIVPRQDYYLILKDMKYDIDLASL